MKATADREGTACLLFGGEVVGGIGNRTRISPAFF